MSHKVLPGQTIGILGGGQLGRMLAFEARRNGYKVVVLDPMEDSPAGLLADKQIVAEFDDVEAAKRLAEMCDVVTYEFENINVELVKELEKDHQVFPGSQLLEVTQHRFLEKSFFKENGLGVTQFAKVGSKEDLVRAEQEVGYPAVLKTCRFGYDGKGQRVVSDHGEAVEAFEELGGEDLIWEKMVDFKCEVSVIAVRNGQGEVVTYPVPENLHHNNILDFSLVPARIDESVANEARDMTKKVAIALNVVGTFCVEFFVLEDGSLLANEIAPRPHNSGHYTLEGCLVSQFENQLRAICGLPLGSTELLTPTVMANLLGSGEGDDLLGVEAAFVDEDVRLHLYEKKSAKLNRKMGHLTVVASDVEAALEKAREARDKLSWGNIN